MKILRPFLWAAVLVTAFVYVTSVAHWSVPGFLPRVRSASVNKIYTEAAAATNFSPDEQNNIDIYKASRDATVNITSVVYREDFFFQLIPEKGVGSGFIINPDGEILTNNHVVGGGGQRLTVTLSDQKKFKATILWTDPRNDLAMVKINAGRRLPFLKLGDSDSLVVGQKVLAIGNPFEFQGTLTTGIVSSLNRSIEPEDGQRLEGLIQTDAAINPGNSGGPLLDSHGNVIGINTAIYGSQGNIGIGFAMPINRAKPMLEEYAQTGRVARPSLGMRTAYIPADFAEELNLPARGGLLIQSVERGSSADLAGLRGPRQVVVVNNSQLGIGGDFIVAIEGEPVEGPETLTRVFNRKRAGDTLHLTIYRNGRTLQVAMKLEEAGRAVL
ncbi:MAG TPA: trypsin-like peptidase domain-containing protein [Bryobacteraceae bacterium]|nr:trypsin-like peptidase domain-containing protein [Bryobacteraceae bacterium]